MPDKIRINETNQENLNRISQLIDASASALGNYLIAKGTKAFEEGFKKLDKDVQLAFKKVLKKK